MKYEFYHNETGEIRTMSIEELIELNDYLSWVVLNDFRAIY